MEQVINGTVCRKDAYLQKLAGDEVELPQPVMREEYYLAKMCGIYEGELPQPVTRTDRYLNHMSANYGQGTNKKFQVVMITQEVILIAYTTV